MTSIVVQGDVKRFCLGNDPTCTGINPCRACWNVICNSVMPAAMRVGGHTATIAQAIAFADAHKARWRDLLEEVRNADPMVFAQIIESRHEDMKREWAEAQATNQVPPLTPFSKVATTPYSTPGPQVTPAPAPMSVDPAYPPPVAAGPSAMVAPEWPPDDVGSQAPMRGDVKEIMRVGRTKNRMRKNKMVPATVVDSNGVNGKHSLEDVADLLAKTEGSEE